jgi:hypothetical protein
MGIKVMKYLEMEHRRNTGTKVYIYKLTVDAGGAPCVSNGELSLAICKPAIRSSSKRGDIILGFAANGLYRKNCLVYLARVTKKIDGRKYFSKSKYAGRPDCIYRWDGHAFEWKSDAKFHSPSFLVHDLGRAPGYKRANVILSETEDDFRYFGAKCPVDYKREYRHLKSLVEELGQGHRVNFGPELRKEIREFIRQLWATSSAYRETLVPSALSCDACDDSNEDFASIEC